MEPSRCVMAGKSRDCDRLRRCCCCSSTIWAYHLEKNMQTIHLAFLEKDLNWTLLRNTVQKSKELGTNSHNSSIKICILHVILCVQQINTGVEWAEKTSDLTETTLWSNANQITSSLYHCNIVLQVIWPYTKQPAHPFTITRCQTQQKTKWLVKINFF